MLFWLILIISLIILLALAWIIKDQLIEIWLDLDSIISRSSSRIKNNQRKNFYWLIWILIAIALTWAVTRAYDLNIEAALASWLALLILIISLCYAINRNYNRLLAISLTIIIILLLGWMIWQFGAVSLAGLLIFLVLIWFVVILVGLIKSMCVTFDHKDHLNL